MVSRSIEGAQRKVEERNFEVRKSLIEYDGVMNEQRTVVYRRRQDWVEDRGLRESILEFCRNRMAKRVEAAFAADAGDWNLDDLVREFKEIYLIEIPPGVLDGLADMPNPAERFLGIAEEALEKAYDAKEDRNGSENMRMLEKLILLETVDGKWMDHLYEMDLLKSGIHLRSMAQQDPKVRYRIEGFEMFGEMWDSARKQVAELVMRVNMAAPRDVRQRAQVKEAIHQQYDAKAESANAAGAQAGEAAKPRTIRNDIPKTGPNELCPCGSGKKFKKCHGR